jgi:tRNA1(Val) A37 N6-methylase TrmN6
VDHAQNILEPSCGSGEIISKIISKYPSANITGVELDHEMANLCTKTYPSANIINHDFLTWKSDQKFDFIVGNPPFVVRPAGYKNNPAIVKGRSNLYVEFLYKCLTEHLADDGILAFVIPSTIGNSVYYEPIRKLIITKDIMSFEILEKHDFCDTNTRLCILILKNSF